MTLKLKRFYLTCGTKLKSKKLNYFSNFPYAIYFPLIIYLSENLRKSNEIMGFSKQGPWITTNS